MASKKSPCNRVWIQVHYFWQVDRDTALLGFMYTSLHFSAFFFGKAPKHNFIKAYGVDLLKAVASELSKWDNDSICKQYPITCKENK